MAKLHYIQVRVMIEQVIKRIVERRGISLPKISMVDGNTVGALGVYLLKLNLEGQTSAALVYKTDLEKLEMGEFCDRFEVALDHAILSLKQKVQGRQA